LLKGAGPSQLVFSFDKRQQFSRGAKSADRIQPFGKCQRIYDTDQPVTQMLTVYPELQILRTCQLTGQRAGVLPSWRSAPMSAQIKKCY